MAIESDAVVNQNSAAEEEGEVVIGDMEPKLASVRASPDLVRTEQINKESSGILKNFASKGTL